MHFQIFSEHENDRLKYLFSITRQETSRSDHNHDNCSNNFICQAVALKAEPEIVDKTVYIKRLNE